MTQPKKILLIAVICLLAVTAQVSALNMSISDMGYTGTQTVQIYANGTLLGTYNTSTNGIILPDVDFVLVVKPSVWNQDIGSSVGNVFLWLSQYWIAIVFVLAAFAMALGLGRR